MELLQISLWGLGGAGAGALLAGAFVLLFSWLGKKYRTVQLIVRRSWLPFVLSVALLVGLLVFSVKIPTQAAVDEDLYPWFGHIQHALAVLLIASLTAYVYSGVGVIGDIAKRRSSGTRSSRRFETQAQVIQRIIRVVVVILGLVLVLLTFPAARAPMASLLASAGLVSVVAGIAAQSTLSNLFAGLQLAFTDAIRVGDTVVVNAQQGTIEEITLSYVVVRLWDDRRLLMPSTDFTGQAFENWTHTNVKQEGTVELQLDWSTPVEAIRERTRELLAATQLWDGRSWRVQVTDSDSKAMTVRVAVSAANSGDLWNLRCYLREELVKWLHQELPSALPRDRIESV